VGSSEEAQMEVASLVMPSAVSVIKEIYKKRLLGVHDPATSHKRFKTASAGQEIKPLRQA
jgi:hypothetical protein